MTGAGKGFCGWGDNGEIVEGGMYTGRDSQVIMQYVVQTAQGPVPSLSPVSRLNFFHPGKLRKLLKNNKIAGLGEILCPFILERDEKLLEIYTEELNAKYPIMEHFCRRLI